MSAWQFLGKPWRLVDVGEVEEQAPLLGMECCGPVANQRGRAVESAVTDKHYSQIYQVKPEINSELHTFGLNLTNPSGDTIRGWCAIIA